MRKILKKAGNLASKIDKIINNRKIFLGAILPVIILAFLFSLATVYVNSYNVTNRDKINTFAILESQDSFYVEVMGRKFEVYTKTN